MRYLRCKCGKSTCYTSTGTQDCEGCEECQTTYAGHPDNHKPLQPHQWKTRYNDSTGKPYNVCGVCHQIDEESYKESRKADSPTPKKRIDDLHENIYAQNLFDFHIIGEVRDEADFNNTVFHARASLAFAKIILLDYDGTNEEKAAYMDKISEDFVKWKTK